MTSWFGLDEVFRFCSVALTGPRRFYDMYVGPRERRRVRYVVWWTRGLVYVDDSDE